MGECDECCDNCGCRWKDIWWVLLCLAILITVALIVVLVAAFAFVRQVVITVDDASLARLALVSTPATAFAYNLSLTLTVRNPNWAMSMKNTEPLEAAYSFDDQLFDRVKLADEGDTHGAKKTRLYRITSGSDAAFVALGNAGVAEFKKENATGVFEVEVAVSGEVKYTARLTKCKIEAKCPLRPCLLLWFFQGLASNFPAHPAIPEFPRRPVYFVWYLRGISRPIPVKTRSNNISQILDTRVA